MIAYIKIIKIIIILFLCFIVGCTIQSNEPKVDDIDLGLDWISNFQKSNGMFYYIYFPDENLFANDENMVRQVGTFFGLIKLDENNEHIQVIEKFREGIQEYIFYDTINNTEIAYIEYNGIAKVNTQAMYILSLTELHKKGFELTLREREDMKKMIEGLYLMENPLGGLWYIYYLPEEHNKITAYGTGEMLYAMISYHKEFGDEKTLLFAKKHFNLYYNISINQPFESEDSRAFYAWVLEYLCELEEIEPGQTQYIETLVKKAMIYRNSNPNCYNKGCIMLPYDMGEASFFEGTSLAYSFMEDEDLKLEVKNYLLKSEKMISDMQVKNVSDYQNKSGRIYQGDSKLIVGGFCNSRMCERIRNDYAQHSLLGLKNMQDNRKNLLIE